MVAYSSIKYSFNEFGVMFVKSVPLNLQVGKINPQPSVPIYSIHIIKNCIFRNSASL